MTTKVELFGQWADFSRHSEKKVDPGQTKELRVDNDRMLQVGCEPGNTGGTVSVTDFSLEVSRADVEVLPGEGFRDGDVPFGRASVGIGRGSSVDVRFGGRVMATVTHVPDIHRQK